MSMRRYDPAAALAVPMNGEIIEDPLSQADYEALKAAMPAWRDVLICKMLRATGVRINELLRSTYDHYSLRGPDYVMLTKREKKARTGGKDAWDRVFIPATLGVEMRDWLSGNAIKPGHLAFDITDRQVRRVFEAAGRKAIGRPVHPHEMRGLYIKTLIDGGVPVAAAAKMVRHASSKTTERYYYDLTTEQRRSINEKIPV